MVAFWKFQPYVCTQKYRLRPGMGVGGGGGGGGWRRFDQFHVAMDFSILNLVYPSQRHSGMLNKSSENM
jgi:hypothetical protein